MALWYYNGKCRWESLVRMTTSFSYAPRVRLQCDLMVTGVKCIDGETQSTVERKTLPGNGLKEKAKPVVVVPIMQLCRCAHIQIIARGNTNT